MVSDKSLEGFSQDYEVSFNQVKDKLKFAGKTLEEWCTFFNFVIPAEIDFLDLVELNRKMDDLTSIAHNKHAIADNTYQLLKRAREKKAIGAYKKMISGAARRPSVAEGENTIASECETEDDKLVIAKAFLDFWDEQIKLLEKRSKIVESLFWCLRNHKEVTE